MLVQFIVVQVRKGTRNHLGIVHLIAKTYIVTTHIRTVLSN